MSNELTIAVAAGASLSTDFIVNDGQDKLIGLFFAVV